MYLSRARAFQKLGLPSRSRADCLHAVDCFDGLPRESLASRARGRAAGPAAPTDHTAVRTTACFRLAFFFPVLGAVRRVWSAVATTCISGSRRCSLSALVHSPTIPKIDDGFTPSVEAVAQLQTHLQPFLASIVSLRDWMEHDQVGPSCPCLPLNSHQCVPSSSGRADIFRVRSLHVEA